MASATHIAATEIPFLWKKTMFNTEKINGKTDAAVSIIGSASEVPHMFSGKSGHRPKNSIR